MKNILMNESLIANNLILKIRKHLLLLKKQLLSENVSTKKEDFTLNNQIPEEWWKESFLNETQKLFDFFWSFTLKLEYRENLHNSLFQKDKIILDLSKMFDPFSFFTISLIDYSMKKNVKHNYYKISN